MTPAPFDYHTPPSIDDALSLLSRNRDSAKVLAGGQSLIPLMAFRLVRPSVLVDLRRISRFAALKIESKEITIGAMVTHRTVEMNTALTSRVGLLADAVPLIGHVAIRNMGTVGGSLAHADPTAEWPCIAIALDAELEVHGSEGARTVAAGEFFSGWMTTVMSEEEILGGLRFCLPGPGTGSAFEEVARRHGDFATVGVAARVSVEDRVVTDARIVLAGAAMQPLRVRAAEQLLIGTQMSDATLGAVGEAAACSADPLPDVHATVGYKRHLASVLTQRALRRAHERATSTVP